MLDPVRLRIIGSLLDAIAEDMGIALERAGISPNIKERLDHSCAIFDADGDLVSQAAHIPVHLGAMPMAVKAARQHVPFEDGDVVLVNDPALGGTHLPDVVRRPLGVGRVLLDLLQQRILQLVLVELQELVHEAGVLQLLLGLLKLALLRLQALGFADLRPLQRLSILLLQLTLDRR